MNRRELLLLAGAATAPRLLRAQQKAMQVIGFLNGGTPPSGRAGPVLAGFYQGLSETGYVEGRNLAIEYRWAEGRFDRLPALAADLVGRKVDMILAGGDPAARAAKNATSTIPIVSSFAGDPVAAGLVASFARPGGNLTGVSVMFADLLPKRLELLSELAPPASIFALMVDPNWPDTEPMIREMQDAARVKGCSSTSCRPAPKARSTWPSQPSTSCMSTRSSSAPVSSSPPDETSSRRSRHAMPFRRVMSCVRTSRPAG